MMRIRLLLIGLVLVCTLAGALAQVATVYVATNGNDAWSGRLAAPNANGTDGPFASLARAQQAVREIKHHTPQAVRVYIRGGHYQLAAPLIFTPEDSGTAEAPVLYTAYRDERPVFSGGTPITGWQVKDGRWVTTLPEVAQGKWNFIQLFVNGERRFRPRLPKKGYFYIAGRVPPSPGVEGKMDGFSFLPGELRDNWTNRDDVEVLAFQVWSMARMRVAEIDAAHHRVRFTGTSLNDLWWSGFQRGKRYLVENVREALTEPGEWYLDRTTGELTYLPRPGEDPKTAVVIAPRLERFIELRGDVENRRWVEHLSFRGLNFHHNNWVTPKEGMNCGQAEWSVPAAVYGIGARHCALERCTIAHIGTYAVEWHTASQHNRIEECDLFDLGAGGVKINTESPEYHEGELATTHNVVRRCRIVGGGRLHPAGIGVWIGWSSHNTVEQNQIIDLYYTGVSVGWIWGYIEPSRAHHNLIADNYIARIGQKVLSDMGGIYTLGIAPGTVLRGNVIQDVEGLEYGGWGIYFDEGSSGVLAEHNITCRTTSGGFHQHYGKENLVRNNIFAFARDWQVQRSRMEPHTSFTFKNNIVYWNTGQAVSGNWTDAQYAIDNNLYWQSEGKPMDFAGKSWEAWQQQGNDAKSLVADPRFVDPDKGDFRLRPGSPAVKIGFQPIKSQAKVSSAPFVVPRGYPQQEAELPQLPISHSFEEWPVDSKAVDAVSNEEPVKGGIIRVSADTAASGAKSLKFTDAANLRHDFNPHLYYTPNYSRGRVSCRFALRAEPGAAWTHEWRDNANPFHVGPSLTLGADGMLHANGRSLLQLPVSDWVRFEIVSGVGEQAEAQYTLSIWLPGEEEPKVFSDLTCYPLSSLNWLGFVGSGTAAAILYLDDLDVSVK